MEIEGRRELAIEAVREAGEILMRNFGESFGAERKEDGSLVTEVDLAAEDAIVKKIKRKYPGDDILSEENSYPEDSEFTWIIDPLDGTHNFSRGIPLFGTSVAVARGDEVVLGVIYIPVPSEFYTAEKGKGAYRNSKRIRVSENTLNRAMMIFDSRVKYGEVLESMGKVAAGVFNVRMFGSSARALTYIADGRADLEVEHHDKPWDFAAGLLLVEEAGGKVSDFQGGGWSPKTTEYVASNGRIHDEVLELLRGEAGNKPE